MICCLCTQETVDGLAIFSLQGKHLRMCEIIEKHFWFKLSNADPLMNATCVSCWSAVNDFHSFYEQVERSHNINLAQLGSLKGESPIPVESNLICDIAIKVEPELIVNAEEIAETNDYDPLLSNSKVEESEPDDMSSDGYVEQDDGTEEDSSQTIDSTDSDTFNDSKSQSVKSCVKRKKYNKKEKEKSSRIPKFKVEARNKEIDEKIAKVLKLGCDLCDFVEPSYTKLMQHMKDTHKVKGYTVCCSKKFTRRHYLTEHIEKHLNPDRFRCEDCGRNFSNKQCLEHHIFLKHQPEEEKIFACNECDKKFAKQYILEKHQIVHQERNQICEVCNKGFHTLSKLKTHIKGVHDSKGNMCEICAKVIMCKTAFKRHLMDHVGAEMPRVQCDICHNWYKNIYVLTKHKRSHDDASIIHKCEVCGKITPSRRALMSHMKYVHTAERKFECNVCQKSFKKAITLREHMTLHTGGVLYKCPHCPRTFNSNSNMYSHRKKAHPEEFEEARKDRIVNGITQENKVIKYSN